jgi:hypothetical protein
MFPDIIIELPFSAFCQLHKHGGRKCFGDGHDRKFRVDARRSFMFYIRITESVTVDDVIFMYEANGYAGRFVFIFKVGYHLVQPGDDGIVQVMIK